MMIIEGSAVTLVLVLLTRIAGKKYDSYLIGLYGASQVSIYFLIWIMGIGASVVNWWATSPMNEFIQWVFTF